MGGAGLVRNRALVPGSGRGSPRKRRRRSDPGVIAARGSGGSGSAVAGNHAGAPRVDGQTVSAALARELRDLVSVHSEWLSAVVPGFAEALRWPESQADAL